MKISGIYKIQSSIKPERIYIGSAIDINHRWVCHLFKLRKNKHHSTKLQNHYNKYGERDLQFSILLECEKGDLIKIEQYYIDSHSPFFNICKRSGSNLGCKLSQKFKDGCRIRMTGKKASDDTKLKMSLSHKNRVYKKGYKHTEEWKLKVSNKLKGRKLSSDHLQKIRDAAKKRIGKEVSDETKLKLRESHKGQVPWCAGLRLSDVHKKNISLSKKGKQAWNKGKKQPRNNEISNEALLINKFELCQN